MKDFSIPKISAPNLTVPSVPSVPNIPKIDVPKISEDSSSEDEKVTIISKPKKTKSKP